MRDVCKLEIGSIDEQGSISAYSAEDEKAMIFIDQSFP
jgi:hypothetical protein